MRHMFRRRLNKKPNVQLIKPQSEQQQQQQDTIPLASILTDNVNTIKRLLQNPIDLLIRQIAVGPNLHQCAVICIDGLANQTTVNDQILKNVLQITSQLPAIDPAFQSADSLASFMKAKALPLNELDEARTMDEVVLAILSGDTALFVDGTNRVFIMGTRGWESRSISEPTSEQVIRGPKEAFTESIQTTTSLIRRRIRDPNLRFDAIKLGRRAKKDVMVVYVEGIVHPKLVAEVKRRLSTMNIDDIEGAGFIEQWIQDSLLSPFPQIMSTERPDAVSAALLQGRVAIILDGTPFQLVVPITLASSFQSPEDYYQNWIIATLIRILRFLAAFFATFLPAFYIALVEYHHGMIPSRLAFSIAGAREGVPFPAVVEAFMMEATLELLREAGIRLPKPIGQTIGIVGGLVIGEAAVQAGVVNPIMVIVVAITAISSFALPSYTFAISLRIIRFGIMMATAVFGLYGLILCYIMINIHIVNLRAFGIPYSAPFAPYMGNDWKDLILRAPLTAMKERPKMMQTKDSERQPVTEEDKG